MSTIEENEAKFTNREIRDAQTSLDLHHKIGRPSQQSYLNILDNNLIRDCPISSADARRAFAIYGKDIASLKGETKRTTPKHLRNPKLMYLPDFIIKWHLDVTLCIDIFYVNQMPFFHKIPGNYNSEKLSIWYQKIKKQSCHV